MNEPLVSVTMVVCNAEKFLAEAIESILGQTLRDFEFIIVDFGSTDSSKAIVTRYLAKDTRIRFREIQNCALPEARNAACSLARGKFIAVMDADDIAVPERFSLQTQFMETHPDVDYLGGATDWIDNAGRFLCSNNFPAENQAIATELMTRCTFCHPTVLVRRSAFTSVGGYRRPFTFAHDYDLALRIIDTFRCANLEQVLLKYRIHTDQVSYRKQRSQTICKLAAQLSARARRNGEPDPLDGVEEITPALLATLGIDEAVQQNALAADCRNWIRSMSTAREYAAALRAAEELLQAGWEHLESWQLADLHLTMSSLHWKQGRVITSALELGRAIAVRPLVLGRPFRAILRRLGRA
jgi:Glycosyl transferase family 2